MGDTNIESFHKWLEENWDEHNIFPPGMDDATALDFLIDYLVPEDYYISYSCGKSQANTEMVSYILQKYSQKYANELKAIKTEKTKFHKEAIKHHKSELKQLKSN